MLDTLKPRGIISWLYWSRYDCHLGQSPRGQQPDYVAFIKLKFGIMNWLQVDFVHPQFYSKNDSEIKTGCYRQTVGDLTFFVGF